MIAADVSTRSDSLAIGESERRFREMMEALPIAVYATDAQGCLRISTSPP